MYKLQVVTTGKGSETYSFIIWENLMVAINTLQYQIEQGIVSDFTVWTDD